MKQITKYSVLIKNDNTDKGFINFREYMLLVVNFIFLKFSLDGFNRFVIFEKMLLSYFFDTLHKIKYMFGM